MGAESLPLDHMRFPVIVCSQSTFAEGRGGPVVREGVVVVDRESGDLVPCPEFTG